MNFGMNTYVRFNKMCAKNCMSVIFLLVEIDKKYIYIFSHFWLNKKKQTNFYVIGFFGLAVID